MQRRQTKRCPTWSKYPVIFPDGGNDRPPLSIEPPYSFLGFDAVTTFSEETINPRRTVPRAIMLVALIGGGIFVAVSYVTQLVHPGDVFEDSTSVASPIALQIGGQLFGAVFLAGLVVAQFASGLAAQASASRLLYAMGRDSVLPKAVFGRLSEKFHTPVANLVITGIVGLIATFLDVATSTSFINFGAFTAFTLVNAPVVFHYVRQRRAGQQLNPASYPVEGGGDRQVPRGRCSSDGCRAWLLARDPAAFFRSGAL
ncbi:APC family permease [Arthrobacter sp. SLBN-112]|uniref:APC family permease n=1 Tax=Arthrobacter sp. SLBN-112 TaxID=2768452 RepID=UPI001F42E5D1|nr:APC family permease [Arthrobacter sp. SLBN-112]